MTTQDDLTAEVMSLQALLTKWSSMPLVLVLPKGWFNDLATRLFEQSIDLQSAIAKANPETDDLADIRKKVFDFDLDVRRTVIGRLWLLGASGVAALIALGVAIYLSLSNLGLIGTFWTAAQIAVGLQFMLLGLAGGVIHLVTAPPPGQATVSLSSLSLSKGLFLAIVVPIVLIVLFSDGKTFTLRQEGQLISFACGYSAKLAIDILNKIVDKATSIVNSI